MIFLPPTAYDCKTGILYESEGFFMEDINAKILQQGFGANLISAYRTRTGLVCKTDMGLVELKKTFSDDVSLEMECSLRKYMEDRGFDGLEETYRTTDDLPCFRMDDSAYVLVKYVPAQRMDIEDKEDLRKMAEVLAEFHNTAEGFKDERIRCNYGLTEEFLEKRTGEFTRVRRRIKNFGDYTPVDLLVVKYYDKYMERIEKATELLKKSRVEEAAKKAENKHNICHNSFKNDNVRKTEKSSIIVSGLYGCTVDISVIDVAHLIRRYIKTDNADERGIAEILKNYGDIRSISDDEMGIIKGMLVYPYKFLKLVNEHYNKRRVCISAAAVERFETCVDRYEKEMRLAESI